MKNCHTKSEHSPRRCPLPQQTDPLTYAPIVPIGCRSLYQRGAAPARFDQQPLEAHAMVLATVDTYHISGGDRWLMQAYRAFARMVDGYLRVYEPVL